MSRAIHEKTFGICENKGTDHLCGIHPAALLSTILYNCSNLNVLAIFCDCIARFMSDLLGNPDDMFSHEATEKKPRNKKTWEPLKKGVNQQLQNRLISGVVFRCSNSKTSLDSISEIQYLL